MALPRILTVEKGKVVIDEGILSIPEFKDVIEVLGINYLQYLYDKYDPESPYGHLDDDEREQEIIKDIPEDLDLNDFTMVKAIQKCEKLYNSPVRKILNGAKRAVEKLSVYFETEELESGRDGNLGAVVTAVIKLPQIITAYQAAENAYKQEVQKSRGNTKRAIDEDFVSNYDD